MSYSIVTHKYSDVNGNQFDFALVLDSVTNRVFDGAVLWDPAAGTFAKVGAVDQRLATSTAPAVPTVMGGQYALAVAVGSNVTLTVPAGATHAYITCDPDSVGNYLRYTYQGTNPSATVGHTLAPGDADWFTDLAALEFSGEGTGGVILHVSYFKF